MRHSRAVRYRWNVLEREEKNSGQSYQAKNDYYFLFPFGFRILCYTRRDIILCSIRLPRGDRLSGSANFCRYLDSDGRKRNNWSQRSVRIKEMRRDSALLLLKIENRDQYALYGTRFPLATLSRAIKSNGRSMK